MGLSMLLGGLRYKEQEFQPIVARVNGSSMTLAVTVVCHAGDLHLKWS